MNKLLNLYWTECTFLKNYWFDILIPVIKIIKERFILILWILNFLGISPSQRLCSHNTSEQHYFVFI